MKPLALPLIAAIGLSACSSGLSTSGGPVDATLNAGFDSERLSDGQTKLMVRTYRPDPADPSERGEEVAGAQCALQSDELSAQVTSPQQVILPRFKQRGRFENRGAPGAIGITCDLGNSTGQTLVTPMEPELMVQQDQGLVVALISLAMSSAASSVQPWIYPNDAQVTLEEGW